MSGGTKYNFVVSATVSLYCSVKANSLEEAVEKAKLADVARLCDRCSRSTRRDEWGIEEIDCDPSEADLSDLHVEGDATLGAKLFQSAENMWIGQP